jgi:SAM-dependent methyltransferase
VAHPGIEVVQADLEDGSPWPLPGRTFGAVVVTNYLHRPLFPALLDALAPGGVLLYETFMEGNERFGRPNRPEFLLRDGELLELVRGRLSVTAYEARMISAPTMAMVQRIAARRP